MVDTDLEYENYSKPFAKKKPLKLTKENQPYVISYLNEVKKRSDFAYFTHKSLLRSFFNYIDKSISEINRTDIKDFFDNVINSKNIKLITKESYRSYLKSFFSHIESFLDDFVNPVPSRQVYKFTKQDFDISKQSEKDEKLLSKQQIFQIIDYCKKNLSRREFIFFSLCACTGARYSEIATIKIKDVILDERYFETGFEKNAMKSTHRTGKSLLFFFPERFKSYLYNYMIPLINKKHIWLFLTTRNTPLSHNSVAHYYRKIRKALGIKFSMHYFRHSMITHLNRNGCPDGDNEILLNHIPSTTQRKHYIHKGIEEKRAIYDKFFPYYEFFYF